MLSNKIDKLIIWLNLLQSRGTDNFTKHSISYYNKPSNELVSEAKKLLQLKEEKKQLPDLILIDGGRGHLNSALESLKKLGLQDKVDLISVAKGPDRKKNEIYKEELDESLTFDENSDMMLYIRKIRDSVHNYVINYNRKKRNMKLRDSMK